MVDNIRLLLMNEIHDYVIKFEEDKARISKNCRHDIYRKISAWVTLPALQLIHKQFISLKGKFQKHENIKPCINTFRNSMGLPCMYIIQKCIDKNEVLKVKDIAYHWRYYRPRPTRNSDAIPIWDNLPKYLTRSSEFIYVDDEPTADNQQESMASVIGVVEPSNQEAIMDNVIDTINASNQKVIVNNTVDIINASNQKEELTNIVFHTDIDPVLQVRDPAMIKPKGRPPDALNKKRTAQEAHFEDSTRRLPSRFEYEEANQRARGRGRGRPRGRGRGRGGRILGGESGFDDVGVSKNMMTVLKF